MFLSPNSGLVNLIITWFGGEPILFMADEGWFRPLYILSGIWQETGFATIIYLAALAGVNPNCMKPRLWMEQVNGSEYGTDIPRSCQPLSFC